MEPDAGRAQVLVSPPAAYASRPRLFGALGRALGMTFAAAGEPSARPVAELVVGSGPRRTAPGVPALHWVGAEAEIDGSSVAVQLAGGRTDGTGLDAALAGRTIAERRLTTTVRGHELHPSSERHRSVTLAASEAGPLWTRVGRTDVAAVAPAELDEGERLRSRLSDGRFLALMPLLELIRRVRPESLPRPAPLATFTFDDPNLHAARYGWLDYRQLADHAARQGYHVGLAFIPLDAFHVNRTAARLFGATPHLSLLAHGADHLRRELDAPASVAGAMAARSRARLAATARRHGLTIDAVMVPPHGRCSVPMMDALHDARFEAVTYWGPARASHDAGGDAELDGWAPADRHVGTGLPGIHRATFGTGEANLALARYLGHPLVLYGHHGDVRDGLDVLAEAAARIGSVDRGRTEWCSAAGLVRRLSWSHRIDGSTLVVTPASLRATVDVPAGIRTLVVTPPVTARPPVAFSVLHEGGLARRLTPGARVALRTDASRRDAPGRVVVLTHLAPGRRAGVLPSVGRRVAPIARRAVTESRDRLHPRLARVRGGRS